MSYGLPLTQRNIGGGNGGYGMTNTLAQQPITGAGGGTQAGTQTQAQQAPSSAPVTNANSLVQSLSQPGYLSGVAQVNPATVQSGTLSPQLLQALSPNSTIQQILQSFQPQEQSAQNNLNQTLADFGVGGGQAVQANQQLQGELASSIAPALANAIQGSQSNLLGASEFNINDPLQAALANQSSANQANLFNATGVNNMNAANVAQYNQNNSQLLQDLLSNYAQQLGIQAGTVNTGQSAGNQNAVNYGQTITETPSPFASIFGGLSLI